jgi:hypothetical protein
MADHPREARHPRVFTAREARQGRIVLTRPWQRAVFLSGIAAAVMLALLATGWMMSH